MPKNFKKYFLIKHKKKEYKELKLKQILKRMCQSFVAAVEA